MGSPPVRNPLPRPLPCNLTCAPFLQPKKTQKPKVLAKGKQPHKMIYTSTPYRAKPAKVPSLPIAARCWVTFCKTVYGKAWTKKARPGWYTPCSHKGICAYATCSCIQSFNFCTPECSVSRKSANFFKGCTCKGGCGRGKGCGCRIANRECNPQVCPAPALCDNCDSDHNSRVFSHCHFCLHPSGLWPMLRWGHQPEGCTSPGPDWRLPSQAAKCFAWPMPSEFSHNTPAIPEKLRLLLLFGGNVQCVRGGAVCSGRGNGNDSSETCQRWQWTPLGQCAATESSGTNIPHQPTKLHINPPLP